MTRDSQLRLLVKYRLLKAVETLGEAELLLNQSAFRGSINLPMLVFKYK